LKVIIVEIVLKDYAPRNTSSQVYDIDILNSATHKAVVRMFSRWHWAINLWILSAEIPIDEVLAIVLDQGQMQQKYRAGIYLQMSLIPALRALNHQCPISNQLD
jgi:hypothetical protein